MKLIRNYLTETMVSFFEPEDIDSMAAAILALYRNPGRRQELARHAMTFLERYGWERQKQDLIRMYDNLWEEKNAEWKR